MGWYTCVEKLYQTPGKVFTLTRNGILDKTELEHSFHVFPCVHIGP